MLMGEHSCALDVKGRLNFPAKFREEMGESFVVARWLDNCLSVFPRSEWEAISAKLGEKSEVKKRNVQRFLYSGAIEVTPDKQGRILLPANLRKHASLEKDVIVIGVRNHAEIWDADAWGEMEDLLDSDSVEAAMEEMDF